MMISAIWFRHRRFVSGAVLLLIAIFGSAYQLHAQLNSGKAGEMLGRASGLSARGQHLNALNLLIAANSLLTEVTDSTEESLSLKYAIQLKTTATLDSLSVRYSGDSYRLIANRYFFPVYEDAIGMACLLYSVSGKSRYFDDGLRLSERMKDLMFRETLRNNFFDRLRDQRIPEAQVLRELAARILALRNLIDARIATDGKRDVTGKMRDSLSTLQQNYDSLYAALLRRNIRFPRGNENLFVNASEAKARIGPGNILINYFFGDHSVYLWLVSQKKLIFRSISTPELLRNEIRTNLKAIEARDAPAFGTSAFTLFNLLLKPVLADVPTGATIHIIPDGELCNLPFDALLTDTSCFARQGFRALSYLIRQYDVRGYPSISSFLAWSAEKVIHNSVETDFFSPVFDSRPGAGYSELRFSGRLPSEIRKSFFVNEFLRDSAGYQQLCSRFAMPGILHLATHVFYNDSNPMASEIILHDKPLYLWEVYHLDVKKELLVLAGCESGRGIYSRSLGTLSISQAFAWAGCRSLIYTLWPVDEKTANNIFGRFYLALGKGLSVPESLRQAKLGFLNDCLAAEAAPYYWAGFQTQGGDVRFESRSPYPEWLPGVATLILSLSAILITGLSLFARKQKTGRKNPKYANHFPPDIK